MRSNISGTLLAFETVTLPGAPFATAQIPDYDQLKTTPQHPACGMQLVLRAS